MLKVRPFNRLLWAELKGVFSNYRDSSATGAAGTGCFARQGREQRKLLQSQARGMFRWMQLPVSALLCKCPSSQQRVVLSTLCYGHKARHHSSINWNTQLTQTRALQALGLQSKVFVCKTNQKINLHQYSESVPYCSKWSPKTLCVDKKLRTTTKVQQLVQQRYVKH